MSFELKLERILDASRANVYRCWTEPELLKQFFAPKPWTTPLAELDVRNGGASLITMRSPDGQDFPNAGLYLDVVPNERLIFTDAFAAGWKPAGRPFMVAELTFEDAPGGKTKYTATARHWSEEAKQEHAAMGFHEGWGIVAGQLEALAKSL